MPQLGFKTCVICEDLRFEQRGLVSIMGAFGATPDAAIAVRSLADPVRLCFVFFGKPNEGTCTFTSELYGPDGKIPLTPFPPEIEIPFRDLPGVATVVFWFNNLILPKTGQYTVKLLLAGSGEECFSDTFHVVPG